MPTMTVSILLLQFFAKQRVQRAYDKKCDDCSDKNQVTHRSLLRLFTEPRVNPVHTQNQDNTDNDEFAHKLT